MTIQEIVRAAYPAATDSECQHILFGRTSYPFGIVTARELYKAASRYARAKGSKIKLCDFCNSMARIDDVCMGCWHKLDRARKFREE